MIDDIPDPVDAAQHEHVDKIMKILSKLSQSDKTAAVNLAGEIRKAANPAADPRVSMVARALALNSSTQGLAGSVLWIGNQEVVYDSDLAPIIAVTKALLEEALGTLNKLTVSN